MSVAPGCNVATVSEDATRSVTRPLTRLHQRASSAVLVALIMFFGSLGMWLVMPIGWLWIGSQVQASSGSMGLGLLVVAAGVVATLGLGVPSLSWLSHRYRAIRLARGLRDNSRQLVESVVALSAAVAIAIFFVWFMLFAGTGLAPVGI